MAILTILERAEMTRSTFLVAPVALVAGAVLGASLAHQAQQPQPYVVGNRLGLPVTPAADGASTPISPNVKVYGAIYSAESCSYDPGARRHCRAEPRRPAERADEQRVGLVHQPRRVGAHRSLDRRAEPAPSERA